MDWSPVGPSTALPGDPGTITAAANRFDDLADSFASQAKVIHALDVESVWVGLAALQFAQARDVLPRTLRALALRCGSAVPELRRWADVVDDTQARGLLARDAAREAEHDLAAAAAGIRAMQAHARDAAHAAARFNLEHPDLTPRTPAPWRGPDWPSLHADAVRRLDRAQLDFDRAVEDHATGRDAAADALRTADDVLDDPWWTIGPISTLLDRMMLGPTSFSFVVTDEGLVLNTRESWLFETYRLAGIDPSAWDPALGLAPLDAIAVSAWTFYGDLFGRNPDQFVWAGMANLAGGTFYAAFQDVHVLRRGLEDGSIAMDEVGDLLERAFPGLPGWAVDELADLAAADVHAFAGEVRFLETRFLDMQRQIFDDLGWQHIAYERGGMAAMSSLHGAGEITDLHVRAWEDIDSGDYARVLQGNRDLLFHEQSTIIGDDYDAIRDRSRATWLMTMGMSVVAHSPVPGGRPFREVVPYEVGGYLDTPDRIPLVPERVPFTDVRIPFIGGTSLDTPDRVGVEVDLPLHNVSIFDNRWRWIETDMLPTWVDHVQDGTAGPLVEVPIAQQAEGQRLIPDWLLPYEP